MTPPFPPIEEHAVVGDLNTIALVGLDGAVGFLCAPRFDSPPVFASLLDRERGGVFELSPVLNGARHKQLYLPDTNVLLTRMLSDGGVGEVSDFMPLGHVRDIRCLVRRAKAVLGEVTFRMRCAPRFGYGPGPHRVEAREDGIWFLPEGDDDAVRARLWSSVPVEVRGDGAECEITLREGQSAVFVFECGVCGPDMPPPTKRWVTRAFKETVNYWRRWIGRSTYRGRWADEVHRSALVLKLLMSEPYGSFVAAPTFSLPEHIGGGRNWDYRYTWLRDAAFTLYALIRIGLTEETASFMDWLLRLPLAPGENGPLQPLYRIDGSSEVEELELDWEGYEGSRPVRVGNGAADQLQLDIYGALMDSVYLYDSYGEPISYDVWKRLVPLTDWVCANWRRRDHGIWEVRGEMREFLSSRVLCWVALDRAIRLATKRGLPAPLERWRATRDEIYESVWQEMWSEERQAFVQAKDVDRLDASALLMPLLRFVSGTDPRWKSTMSALRRELVRDSLVARYRIDDGDTDGIVDGEGTFTICSFWYAECLSRAGDPQAARFVFEKVLGFANHVGLFAEQLGVSGRQLGNFPQAFTHLALISAAFEIDRRLSKEGWNA